jgi:hypothetical protein
MKPDSDSLAKLVAGLRDLRAAFPGARISVPKTWIEGDSLHWSRGVKKTTASDHYRLLANFVALADTSNPTRILEYAKHFGPLWLCARHRRPTMHRLDRQICRPQHWGRGRELEYAEPLSAWRHYISHARAILTLSAALRKGEEGDPADWRLILGGAPLLALGPSPLEVRLVCLSHAVNQWLNAAPVSPFLWVADGRFRLTFAAEASLTGIRRMLSESQLGPRVSKQYPQTAVLPFNEQALASTSAADSLFAALAVQLAFAVSGGAGYAYCSACGALYAPRRAPAPNRLHFCDACGLKAARRLAKRRAREKRPAVST